MPYFTDSPEPASPPSTDGGSPAPVEARTPTPPPSTGAVRPAIATMSLGSPRLHPLTTKLEAAASMGFQGVELFWDDFDAFADSFRRPSTQDEPYRVPGEPPVIPAARAIRRTCARLGLCVVSLQPFRDADGITDPARRAASLARFRSWLAVAAVLGAPTIGVPATITPGVNSGDPAVMARDLRELALLARPHGVSVTYENLCFAAHVRSWGRAWDVVRRAGEDNIAFLPDTFNLCGEAFADPTVADGVQPGGDAALERSIDALVRAVPMDRMPLLQVADAELMDPPLIEGHPWLDGCWSAKMAWSRHARLFPLEEPGYLPVRVVVAAFVEAGWAGWVSLEVFSRTTAVKGEATIWEHAERAWRSWEKLVEEMGWEARPGIGASGHEVRGK